MYKKLILKSAQKVMRKVGINVSAFFEIGLFKNTHDYIILQLLKNHNIDVILDVGANKGQFASVIFQTGYKGKVVSFEPTSEAYKQLLAVSKFEPLNFKNIVNGFLKKKNSKWFVAERCAIGEMDGETEINISKNSESSSILQMCQSHLNAAPNTYTVGKEKVNLKKLDTVAIPYLQSAKNPLLKLDVQGYEDFVLRGAKKILPQLKGIMLEMSLVQLYKGETLYLDMIKKIENMGFELYDINPGWRDKNLKMLQMDCIFFRK